METFSNTRGYALLETLVYIAVLAVVTTAVVNALLLGGTALRSIRATRQTVRAVELAFDRIAREVRSSGGVTVASSIFGVSPGQLTLDTTAQVALSGGTLTLRPVGSGVATALLPTGVDVTSFVVRRLITPNSEAVRLETVIEGEPYTLTVVARGSY